MSGNRTLNPLDLDLPTVERAIRSLARQLHDDRDAWCDGDREINALLASGFSPETSGFDQLARGSRVDVDIEIRKMRADIVAFLLPHLDASLRERVIWLLGSLDPDRLVRERDGEDRRAGRVPWDLLVGDSELEDLSDLLLAEADAVALQVAILERGRASAGSTVKAHGEATDATRLETPEGSPEKVPLAPGASRPPRPCEIIAWRSLEYAREQQPERESDALRATRVDYEFICDHGCPAYAEHGPPGYETWSRQCREYRRLNEGPVNTPRAGRTHGRSIVQADEL